MSARRTIGWTLAGAFFAAMLAAEADRQLAVRDALRRSAELRRELDRPVERRDRWHWSPWVPVILVWCLVLVLLGLQLASAIWSAVRA